MINKKRKRRLKKPRQRKGWWMKITDETLAGMNASYLKAVCGTTPEILVSPNFYAAYFDRYHKAEAYGTPVAVVDMVHDVSFVNKEHNIISNYTAPRNDQTSSPSS